jgi:UDP-N-acetylglucosamine--N-acetylmuramyl-(pentapeptide) pyrophosphoryl-undecaprenol N-acetylglucosamine transferase
MVATSSITQHGPAPPLIAIACGGTGGHLFPGLAVAEVLQQCGCDVALLVSPKQVDQDAVKCVSDMPVITLPAVALQNGDVAGFLRGAWKSYRACGHEFRRRAPRAVLAMGGFTSAPPILAGKKMGAAAFLHEANAIPGRASRWLAPRVDEVFLAFPQAGRRLSARNTTVTGMPVRSQFLPADSAACRLALGLAPDRPVLLITGGSQGASAINDLMSRAFPAMLRRLPDLQCLHLTGTGDFTKVQSEYAKTQGKARVFPFLTEMELAFGAATLAVTRAGGSSLAEMAAMRVPAILIPYPHAADNHQFYNAKAFAESGAARQLDQANATPERLTEMIVEMMENEPVRLGMSAALARWNTSDAAKRVANRMLTFMGLESLASCLAEGSPAAVPVRVQIGAVPEARDRHAQLRLEPLPSS